MIENGLVSYKNITAESSNDYMHPEKESRVMAQPWSESSQKGKQAQLYTF